MSETEEALKEAFALEYRAIRAMSKPQQFQYIKGVIENLGLAIKRITDTKGKLNQAKLANQLFGELNSQAASLLPPILFTIKEEYQLVYVNLIQQLAGDQ